MGTYRTEVEIDDEDLYEYVMDNMKEELKDDVREEITEEFWTEKVSEMTKERDFENLLDEILRSEQKEPKNPVHRAILAAKAVLAEARSRDIIAGYERQVKDLEEQIEKLSYLKDLEEKLKGNTYTAEALSSKKEEGEVVTIKPYEGPIRIVPNERAGEVPANAT